MVAFALVIVCLLALPVLAHEGREVGDYLIEFGWRNEPAHAGLMNGPEVYIVLHDAEHDAAFPDDIAVSLQAEVTFGSETTTLELRPMWGTTGHYIADLMPMLPGDYTFRITGTIGETAVDETFNSADGEFSTVEPLDDVQFPSNTGTIAELQAQIDELRAMIAALE